MQRAVYFKGESGWVAVNPSAVRLVVEICGEPKACDIYVGFDYTSGVRVHGSFAVVMAALTGEPVGKILRNIGAPT
jgi:hypothetical protein